MAPATTTPDAPKREMKVLVMGLPRTGSASMAEALAILGYKDVHHGLQSIDKPEQGAFFERAAEASFSTLPTYTGKPFTQDDWEELYGPYEAATDVAGSFGLHMIRAYPDAKVVLPIRDFDRWAKSFEDGVMTSLFGPVADFSVNVVEPLLGSRNGPGMRKVVLGFFQSKDADDVRRNMRKTYDRHHREMRENVPPEQLLEYTMGDGWGPLCEFLGKPVPDVEFPWVNEASALKAKVKAKVLSNIRAALLTVAPWTLGAVALGTAAVLASRRS